MESQVNVYTKAVPEWPGLKQPRPEEKSSNQENNENKKLKRSDRQIKQQLETEVAGSSDVTRTPVFQSQV